MPGLSTWVRVIHVMLVLTVVTLVLGMTGSVTMLVLLDNSYVPTRAGAQVQAEALASHLLYRLTEPPLPLIPVHVESDTSRPRAAKLRPQAGLPPRLTRIDHPRRHPIAWSSTRGWLSDVPPVHMERYERFFGSMANNDSWTNGTLTQVFQDSSFEDAPMVFAGTWTFTDDEIAFVGALTPLEGFLDVYLPLWTEEYIQVQLGAPLTHGLWRAAEIRFRSESGDTVVVRKGAVPDLAADLAAGPPGGDGEVLPPIRMFADALSLALAPYDGWRNEVGWYGARLAPLMDRVEIGLPMYLGSLLLKAVRIGSWIVVLAAVAALVLTFLGQRRISDTGVR